MLCFRNGPFGNVTKKQINEEMVDRCGEGQGHMIDTVCTRKDKIDGTTWESHWRAGVCGN